MKRIKDIIKQKLFKQDSKVIQNINRDYRKDQKKILVSYIATNYYIDIENNYVGHTNIYESQQIIKVLSELDFCIDLTFCNDKGSIDIIRNKTYDYILGFGEVFYEACKINNNAIKIIYATENPPEFSLKAEMERIEYYNQRNKKKAKLSRSLIYYKPEHFQNVDYCIALGETELYNGKFIVKRLYPTGFINENFSLNPRKEAKENFLWFGSQGAIHKGLDILIDIFNRRNDVNLYICGLNKEEEQLLNINNKNIRNLGRLDVKQYEFCELANRCDYVILPSCSEGISTAVLTCMNHGLIPIVQKNTGFNSLEEYCYILDDYRIAYINEVISEVLLIDKQEILDKRKRILDFSRTKFNINRYTSDFKRIMESIINKEVNSI